MQRAFSYESRQQVTEAVPELKMGNAMTAPTPHDARLQYAPIPGLPLVSQFRYPLWDAKPHRAAAGRQAGRFLQRVHQRRAGQCLHTAGQAEAGPVPGRGAGRPVPRPPPWCSSPTAWR
ncbi:hypothetical protein ACPA9J_29580 [Pseudomonas aeruginosa]